MNMNANVALSEATSATFSLKINDIDTAIDEILENANKNARSAYNAGIDFFLDPADFNEEGRLVRGQFFEDTKLKIAEALVGQPGFEGMSVEDINAMITDWMVVVDESSGEILGIALVLEGQQQPLLLQDSNNQVSAELYALIGGVDVSHFGTAPVAFDVEAGMSAVMDAYAEVEVAMQAVDAAISEQVQFFNGTYSWLMAEGTPDQQAQAQAHMESLNRAVEEAGARASAAVANLEVKLAEYKIGTGNLDVFRQEGEFYIPAEYLDRVEVVTNESLSLNEQVAIDAILSINAELEYKKSELSALAHQRQHFFYEVFLPVMQGGTPEQKAGVQELLDSLDAQIRELRGEVNGLEAVLEERLAAFKYHTGSLGAFRREGSISVELLDSIDAMSLEDLQTMFDLPVIQENIETSAYRIGELKLEIDLAEIDLLQAEIDLLFVDYASSIREIRQLEALVENGEESPADLERLEELRTRVEEQKTELLAKMSELGGEDPEASIDERLALLFDPSKTEEEITFEIETLRADATSIMEDTTVLLAGLRSELLREEMELFGKLGDYVYSGGDLNDLLDELPDEVVDIISPYLEDGSIYDFIDTYVAVYDSGLKVRGNITDTLLDAKGIGGAITLDFNELELENSIIQLSEDESTLDIGMALLWRAGKGLAVNSIAETLRFDINGDGKYNNDDFDLDGDGDIDDEDLDASSAITIKIFTQADYFTTSSTFEELASALQSLHDDAGWNPILPGNG